MVNIHKKNKSKGLVLNAKTESINIDIDSKINHEVVENLVKYYKKYLLKELANDSTTSNMKF